MPYTPKQASEQTPRRTLPSGHNFAGLTLSIDSDSSLAGYAQLVEQIQQAIHSQQLPEGTRLPSSRALAQQLGVSRSMAVQAYDELISQGYLVSKPKRGIEVAVDLQSATFKQARSSTSSTDHSQSPHKPSSPERQQPVQLPPQMLDSGADSRAFPNKQWAAAMRKSWLSPDSRILEGRYHAGFPPLRRAITDYLRQVRRLEVNPEQVFITSGNRDSLSLLQHCIEAYSNQAATQQPARDHTDNAPHAQSEPVRWFVEDPTFPPIRSALAQQQPGTLRIFSEDEINTLGPDYRSRSSEAGFADYGNGTEIPTGKHWATVVTPNRHYPLGISWRSELRQKWLQAAVDNRGWILEDDYDTEFVFQGKPGLPLMQTAMLRADTAERVCLLGSFSKILFRGLRIGYLVVPQAMTEHMLNTQRALGLSASLIAQPAVAEFIESGQLARHLNRMRRHYRDKRDQTHQLLQQYLSEFCDWQLPNAGMHFLLRFKQQLIEGFDESADTQREQRLDEELAETMAQEGLRLMLLADHFAQPQQVPPHQQGFLVGFTAQPIETTAHWIERIAKALKKLTNQEYGC